MKYYLENIENLEENQFFVFGSNLAGIHGAGASKQARSFGACLGVGTGFSGRSYAIPTTDHNIKTLPLDDIQEYINLFMKVAGDNNPEFNFYVTKIGCGIAGYKDSEIAPMFKSAPDNCYFHIDWFDYLEDIIYE